MTRLREKCRNMFILLKLPITRVSYFPPIFRMSDDPFLQMYEIQAGLEEIKGEMKTIKKENTDLKNNMAFNNLIGTGHTF